MKFFNPKPEPQPTKSSSCYKRLLKKRFVPFFYLELHIFQHICKHKGPASEKVIVTEVYDFLLCKAVLGNEKLVSNALIRVKLPT